MKLSLFFSIALLLPLTATADDFRGAWIASVHNINFPSSEGLSADAQRRRCSSPRCGETLQVERSDGASAS